MSHLLTEREAKAMMRAMAAWYRHGGSEATGFYGGWMAGIEWWRENAPAPDETPALPLSAFPHSTTVPVERTDGAAEAASPDARGGG